MSKPILHYVHYSAAYLSTPYSVMSTVTAPLAKSGKITFQDDSEIFEFHRSPYRKRSLSAYIAPVDKSGKIMQSNYVSHHDSSQFHPRTRELYLAMLGRREDISPILNPSKEQLRGTEPFPSDTQKEPLKKLLAAYLQANDDPYPRLAVLSSIPQNAKHTLETFLAIAHDLAEPVEVEYTAPPAVIICTIRGRRHLRDVRIVL